MTEGWKNRIVGYEAEVDPEQLLANPLNWREHPGAQRSALRGSLTEVGWVDTVMVNNTTGNVVDGHARIEEAISAGATVPVLYVDLTEEEERLVLATFDPIGALATANKERLDELLTEVTTGDGALRDLLTKLAEKGPGKVEGQELDTLDLGFQVMAEVGSPEERDRLVGVLRDAGFLPTVKNVRLKTSGMRPTE